jgi:hypothetical protein
VGQEYPLPGEDQDIRDMIDTILQYLKKTYPPGKSLRTFHAKMHAFLEADFIVATDLPVYMQYGFLQPGKTYKAWVRFSNGNTRVKDDRKKDLRGMAIKLLQVPGNMIVPDEQLPQSQDILLVSYPTLMSPDIPGFKKNIRAVCGGFAGLLRFGLNPLNWPTLVRTLRSMEYVDNLLSRQYWSVAPSRLGTPDQAIKYSVIPSTEIAVKYPTRDHSDFLREVIQQELDAHDFHFDVLVQFQEDAESMPIENACVEWKSTWHKVAEIVIPKQIFNTPERKTLGEHATYSPWHCLPEHQPLGGISRARQKVYAAISSFRSQNNQNL